jgi:hypothetical protein
MGMYTGSAAAWWGYAEGNATVLGVVVIVVSVAAVTYVVRRFWRR